MKLPKADSNYRAFVDFGRYVTASLQQAKYDNLAADVDSVTQVVKTKGRAWEDSSEDVSRSTAQRDALDHDLDTTAKTFRLALASRAINANRQTPYTSIFPKGIAYYTAAPLSENGARYGELLTRAVAALPSDDAALVALQKHPARPARGVHRRGQDVGQRARPSRGRAHGARYQR